MISAPFLVFLAFATTLVWLRWDLSDDLGLPKDCVIHSLRHTFLTRFGEAGADAFTIKKVAVYSSVTISERNINPHLKDRSAPPSASLMNRDAVEKVRKKREVPTISATVPE